MNHSTGNDQHSLEIFHYLAFFTVSDGLDMKVAVEWLCGCVCCVRCGLIFIPNFVAIPSLVHRHPGLPAVCCSLHHHTH